MFYDIGFSHNFLAIILLSHNLKLLKTTVIFSYLKHQLIVDILVSFLTSMYSIFYHWEHCGLQVSFMCCLSVSCFVKFAEPSVMNRLTLSNSFSWILLFFQCFPLFINHIKRFILNVKSLLHFGIHSTCS